MKRKTQKHQTKKNIKFNNALHTSRCTAVQDKTSLRHTFFNFIGNSDLLRRKKKHIFAEHMLDKTAF